MPEHDGAQAPYRIHGWRWHHMSVLRDLTLVRGALSGTRVCAPGGAGARARRDVSRAYAHVLDDNFEVHDAVETRLLFPWVRERCGPARRLALGLLAGRRRALVERRERLRDDIARLAGATPRCCEMRAARAAADVELVRRAAATYFEVAERVVVPAVRTGYSVAEQSAFNRRVLKMLSPLQAQIVLVVFSDTLYDRNGGASEQDRKDFERQVPAPVRALVPLWRSSLLAFRSAVLNGKNEDADVV